MQRLPRLVSAGDISPKDWNRFADILEKNFRALELQPSPKNRILSGQGQISGGSSSAGGPAGSSNDFPWKIIPSQDVNDSGDSYAVVEIYYGEIDYTTLDDTVEGIDGIMDLSDPFQFTIDPCDANGDGSDGDTSRIFLTITYDTDSREITVRDIDWTDVSSPDVPDNTDTEKHFVIGEVKLSVDDSGSTRVSSYSVVNQQLNANIHTDQALYMAYDDPVGDGGSGMLNTFFADEGGVQIYNQESEYADPFIAQLNADSFLLGDNNAEVSGDIGDIGEQIKLIIDQSGTAEISGHAGWTSAGNDGPSFELKADDGTAADSTLSLDDGSGNYTDISTSEVHIHDDTLGDILLDITEGKIIISKPDGAFSALYAVGELELKDSAGHDLILDPTHIEFSDGAEHGWLDYQKVTIWDDSYSGTLDSNSLTIQSAGENEKIIIHVDDAGESTIGGQSGSGAESFILTADDDAGWTNLQLSSDTGAYQALLEANNTDQISRVKGNAATGAQNFELVSDDSTATSSLSIFNNGESEEIILKTDDTGITSITGKSGAGGQNFELIADDDAGITHLQINDSGNAEYVRIESDESSGVASVSGTANTGAKNFLLEANDSDDVSRLFLSDGSGHTVELKIDTSSTEGHLEINDSNGAADYASDQMVISDMDGKTVTIDIPTDGSDSSVDAYWYELDICVDGSPKKIKILATDPYDP